MERRGRNKSRPPRFLEGGRSAVASFLFHGPFPFPVGAGSLFPSVDASDCFIEIVIELHDRPRHFSGQARFFHDHFLELFLGLRLTSILRHDVIYLSVWWWVFSKGRAFQKMFRDEG